MGMRKSFRRVRDQHGNLKLSKAAKAFHPGRGIYRSSYKNARRLAATETNIAYRTSNYLRWQQLDFVVGIEIHLSNNHTLNGKPFHDICDTLAGRYPKTFKWTGWHPLCRCYATSILITEEESEENIRRALNGEKESKESVNTVHDVPEAFKEWVKEHSEKIKRSKKLPYFIEDNRKRVDSILGIASEPKKTPLKIAKERHDARTPEDVERIQTEWNRRRLLNANDGIEQLDLFRDKTYQDLIRSFEDDIALGEHKAFEHDFAEMKRMITAARNVEYLNTERLMKTPLFKSNNDALESSFGTRGTAMPFRPANELRGNPHYAKSSTYRVNCQTCVVANEMRRRGFNIEALPNTKGSALERLSYHTESAWIDDTGNTPTSNISGLRKVKRKRWDGTEYEAWEKTCKNRKQMVAALESDITEDGRYHIKWTWAKRNCGHIITVERVGGKFRYYDPQNGKVIDDFFGYINGIKTAKGIRWLRVDTLRVNPDVAKKVLTKPTTGSKSGTAASGGISAKLRVIPESECNYTLPNGGRVSTPAQRLSKGNSNKQEQGKFEKELRMANRFANGGHKIEFAADDAGSFDVLIDGVKADFKSTSSPSNIIKYAKHATREQGADIVLFEFSSWGTPYIEAIDKLKRMGIHGKYLMPGDSQIYSF